MKLALIALGEREPDVTAIPMKGRKEGVSWRLGKKSFARLRDNGEGWLLSLRLPGDMVSILACQEGYKREKGDWISFPVGEGEKEQALALFEQAMALARNSPTRRIYEAVKKIPRGKVATYGRIAAMAGDPGMARAVGNALHRNPDPEGIPCYRVVNARGALSGAFAFGGEAEQERLLTEDGVEVRDGKVDLSRYMDW